MSVNTILYLNPKWEIRDIATVAERTQGKEVRVEALQGSIVGCFNIFVGDRRIFAITNNQTPIGVATYLSIGANEGGKRILRDIAEVLGGLFQPEDYNENYELIQGEVYEGNGLPFFIKYAIVNDGIDPKDTEAFLQSMQKLRKELNDTDSSLGNLLEKVKPASSTKK